MYRNVNKNREGKVFQITKCRICNSTKLYNFLNLGLMPIPNGFLTKEQLSQKEIYYPLEVCVCKNCWLVQLNYIVQPEIMFKNYLYIPSTSLTVLKHFKSLADEAIKNYFLKKTDLVIDIGSNDGTLLSFFKEREISVLGIDPASNLIQVARMKGIDTIDDFFTTKLAISLAKQKKVAKIITATNVLAHVNDLNDLCQGISILLEEDGVFISEFPYLLDLLNNNEFDTIYHEHLSYFSLSPLMTLFNRHGLRIIDVKQIPIHGGSLRLSIANKNSIYKSSIVVEKFLYKEKLERLNQRITYDNFTKRVKVVKKRLKRYLKILKKKGKKIIGYGASAKGNVLLNYCNINNGILDYIVDSIPYKQGRFTPGTHIPIHSEKRLEEDSVGYILLLAWNFAEEILHKQCKYREKGGKFIITIPNLKTT